MTIALILAAGQGTRLRPLTNDKPKCLVEINGKSILERQTSTLRKAGIQDIKIVTGYKGNEIEKLGFETIYNKDYKKTNMVQSLFCARDFFEGSDVDLVISYGDIIYQQDNLASLLDSTDEISLMIDMNWRALWSIRFRDPLDDAETLILDSSGHIRELGKKPKNYDQIHGQYTGLIKIRKDKVKDLISFYKKLDKNLLYDDQDFKNMYMTSLIQLLIEFGWKVKATKVKNGWLEIDSVSDLDIYNKLQLNKKLDHFIKLN